MHLRKLSKCFWILTSLWPWPLPWGVFQCFTILSVKNFFLNSKQNFLWYIFKPFPHILSLDSREVINITLLVYLYEEIVDSNDHSYVSPCLSWTNLISSATPHKLLWPVLPPSLFSFFAHMFRSDRKEHPCQKFSVTIFSKWKEKKFLK